MQLQHIKDEVCPFCKSLAVEEARDNQHSNGHWNEYRRFKCGAMHSFSPNYMKVEVSMHCPETPKEKEKTERRVKATRKIEETLENLRVDDEFKISLLSHYILSKYRGKR